MADPCTRDAWPPGTAAVHRGCGAVRLRIRGQIQGVGFRPFVHRLAHDVGVTGTVRNDPAGVTVDGWGPLELLDELERRIVRDAPPLARVDEVVRQDPPDPDSPPADFRIVASERVPDARGPVTVDSATCADCLAEMSDPHDRRHHHGLVNCTSCGPRYTIVRDLPYDRPLTTMAGFPMCPVCAVEYEDPSDRRFHAQPVCCPECGPQAELIGANGVAVPGDPYTEAARLLGAGAIVAMKGLGGYHLVVDATDANAVARLRRLKRPGVPRLPGVRTGPTRDPRGVGNHTPHPRGRADCGRRYAAGRPSRGRSRRRRTRGRRRRRSRFLQRRNEAMKIEVVENVQKANDEVAAQNRAELRARKVASINLMGSPGCGKTAWLERTLEALTAEMTVGVITGDLTTTRDAERIEAFTPHVVQINTGRGCHLEAHQVRRGLQRLDLDALDLLVIENVGNLICPVSWDLGEDRKVGMFSVTEGDDKPAKHPYVVLAADLLLLNKIDLLPYVRFSPERFREDVAVIQSDVDVLDVSATEAMGLDTWIDWVRALVRTTGMVAAPDPDPAVATATPPAEPAKTTD